MKSRNYQYDFMRAFAIISVLIIHSSLRFNDTTLDIRIGEWFSTFTRPCIAIFLFLSGALYKSKINDLNYFFKKIKRIISPYLFFSFFGIIYSILVTKGFDLTDVLFSIILGNTMPIYYYVFVIVVVYIIAELLNKFKFIKNNLFTVVLVLLIINIIHNIFYFYYTSTLGWSYELQEFIGFRSIFVWLVFFYMGVLFNNHKLQIRLTNYRKVIIFSWIITFSVYNFLWFFNLGNISGYLSVIGSIYSVTTIFVLLVIKIKPNKFILFLSQTSYTIYLSHIFFIYLLMAIERILEIDFPVLFNIISFSISLFGSYFVYKIGKLVFKNKSYYVIGS